MRTRCSHTHKPLFLLGFSHIVIILASGVIMLPAWTRIGNYISLQLGACAIVARHRV